MRSIRKWYLVIFPMLFAFLMTPQLAFSSGTETVQSFRSNFNLMLDKYQAVFQKINNTRGLNLVDEAKKGMEGVTDEQLAQMFTRTGVPDLSEALRAVDTLVAATPKAQAPLAAPKTEMTPPTQPESAPFPEAPPIISECDNIAHSSSFSFGALIAFQVARGIIEAAQFGCEQMVVILGEGANTAALCIPLAIAKDAAAIPWELADFCSGEEDTAVLQGSYERLEHIHNDLLNAQVAIINNNNTNKETIINNDNSNKDTIVNNDNTNTSTIVKNDNSNKDTIITNDNTNTTSIINNDNTNTTKIINNDNSNTSSIITNDNENRKQIISELRALGCEIVRLLNTPEGQRASSILACTGSPGFPYNWPEKR